MNKYFSLVKISHSIFALPFAMIGFFLALKSQQLNFDLYKLFLVLMCMITARNAAMAFNRWLDQDIDAKNERTKMREIPSGQISSGGALAFVVLNCGLFLFCAFFINQLCFMLSPIALLVVLGYSYTKRFTFLCHFILGIGLGLAPIGAYLALTAQFDMIPLLYSFAVMCWVAGFDVIYALQDEEFDASNNLYSIPSSFGKGKAMWIARVLHVASLLLLLLPYFYLSVSVIYLVAWTLFALLIVRQHYLVETFGLEKINLAFFTMNGMASLLFGFMTIISFYF
jgi:4-hydroxybenzoate polyprenyltransferase